MRTWEYATDNTTESNGDPRSPGDIANTLNTRGSQGWELVTVAHFTLFYRREVGSNAVDRTRNCPSCKTEGVDTGKEPVTEICGVPTEDQKRWAANQTVMHCAACNYLWVGTRK